MPKFQFRVRSLLMLMVVVALCAQPVMEVFTRWYDSRNRNGAEHDYSNLIITVTPRIIIQDEPETVVIGVFEDDDEV